MDIFLSFICLVFVLVKYSCVRRDADSTIFVKPLYKEKSFCDDSFKNGEEVYQLADQF